jgi:hypothetical protein
MLSGVVRSAKGVLGGMDGRGWLKDWFSRESGLEPVLGEGKEGVERGMKRMVLAGAISLRGCWEEGGVEGSGGEAVGEVDEGGGAGEDMAGGAGESGWMLARKPAPGTSSLSRASATFGVVREVEGWEMGNGSERTSQAEYLYSSSS